MTARRARPGKKDKKKDLQEYEVRFLPFEVSVKVPAAATIFDAARWAQIPLQASCGGKGTCGDCLVQIGQGNFTCQPSAALSAELLKKGYVLACQAKVKDNLRVDIPQFEPAKMRSVTAAAFFEKNKNSLSGVYEINPAVRCVRVRVPLPSLENNLSDLKRLYRELQKALAKRDFSCEYSALKKLAQAVRKNKGEISVILFLSEQTGTVIDVKPDDEDARILGIACDLGTTNIVLTLVNLKDGAVLQTNSCLNQQVLRGEDVISRINYAQKAGHLQELHHLSLATVNQLIEKTARAAKVSPSEIYSASFSGNTTMMHLFLNLEPENIRQEPYVPTFNEAPVFLARDLGLKIYSAARVYLAPAVGSYVGGDITSGLLCTPLLRDSEKISLFIDAGTNGEIVIGNKSWLMTCACSTGPAFEGGGIKCGRPASDGAIEKIEISENDELHYSVINGLRPKGLCGSALVDLLAELFSHGYIDRSGKFNLNKLSPRWVATEKGKAFLIEEKAKTFWGHDLFIAEKEIFSLILAKGAIFSACSLLLKRAGLGFNQIDDVFLAGGFGQSLNIENAIRLGLLPDLERSKFHYLGNSSLLGAYLILLSDQNKHLVEEIAEKMTYIELSTTPEYMDEFTGALFLPHTDIKLFPSVKSILAKKSVKHISSGKEKE